MFNQSNIILFSLVLVIFLIEGSFACNGFKIRILKIKNCNGTDAILLLDEKGSVKLNKDCEIVSKGCLKSKGFETAQIHYAITKNKMPLFEGDMDLCKQASKMPAEVKSTLSLLGLPTECPLKEGDICAPEDPTKRINISKHKGMLAMALGKITAKVFIQHDKGTSCFITTTELYR